VPHVIVPGPLLAALLAACVHATGAAAVPVLSFEQALLLAGQGPEVQLALGQRLIAQRQRDAAAGLVAAELRVGYAQTWSGDAGPGSEAAGAGRGSLQPLTLSATLNVLPFGPAAENLQRAEWLLEEATLELREAEANASVAAAERYLAALRAHQETALREEQVALAERRLEAVETRFAVGAANESQLLESELDSSAAHNALADALRQQAGALASLSLTLDAHVLAVAGEPPPASLPRGLVLEQRHLGSTRVRSAEIRVLQAELAHQARLRDFLPSGAVSFDIVTASSSQSLQIGASLDTRTLQPHVSLAYDPWGLAPGGSARSASIAVSARIPLDASMPAALDAARLHVDASRLRAEHARDLAQLEADTRRRQWEAAIAGEVLSRQVRDARSSSLKMTVERVALGIATGMDARQAELDLQSAELVLLRNHDAALIALMRLMQSLALDPTEVF
jgi:outer membrane protein